MVDVLLRIIAGPETLIPDFIASRSKTGELKLYAVPLISKYIDVLSIGSGFSLV